MLASFLGSTYHPLMRNDIVIVPGNPALLDRAVYWSSKLGCPVGDAHSQKKQLWVTEKGLALSLPDQPKLTPLRVDFTEGQAEHRRRYGGGKGQLIAKAVGLNKMAAPTVVDVTAGLGRDGFVLATLGCQVTLVERSAIIAALLEDGLDRLKQASNVESLTLSMVQMDGLAYLDTLLPSDYPDVIYLDPMFPKREKSALVKKAMIYLRDVVGDDADADQLFRRALRCAKNRVVVKRSKLAPNLGDKEPDWVLAGKSSRYDVYRCDSA